MDVQPTGGGIDTADSKETKKALIGMTVAGGDFSKWDGTDQFNETLNWDLYTWSYAFIKVSEGKAADPLFLKQWSAARGKTLRGAYHFFRCFVDTEQSVQNTIQLLGNDLGELPLVLDLESLDGFSPTYYVSQAKSWLSWYEDMTQVRPLIYSRSLFLSDEIQCAKYDFFKFYKLWLAEYHFDKLSPVSAREQRLSDVLNGVYPVQFPKPPAPFTRVSFWQFTEFGIPGVTPGYPVGSKYKKQVDWNLYNGDSTQKLFEEFEVQGIPTPDPDPISTDAPAEILIQTEGHTFRSTKFEEI